MIDISKKPYSCIYKELGPGFLHISAEFIAENEKTSTIQVSKFFFESSIIKKFSTKKSYMKRILQRIC